MNRRRSSLSTARSVRRDLVRIAGSHNRIGQAFACASIAEWAGAFICYAEQASVHVYSDRTRARMVRTVAASVPRSLRRFFRGELRVLAT